MTRSERSRAGESGRERAVSDVLAFTLTFAIIITAVGLVSTGALTPLTTFTDNQQIVNSDRGFQATASTIDNLHRSGDTYRQFDVVPGSGDVFVNETAITIESDDIDLEELDESATSDQAEIEVQSLENVFDEAAVNYEAGAVMRSNSIFLSHSPSITCDDDVAIVSLVNLTTDETISAGGSFSNDVVLQPTNLPSAAPVGADNRFVSFEVERGETRQVRGEGEFTIDVSETAQPDRWDRYFEDEEWDDEGDRQWSCDPDDTVVIRVVDVELSLLDP